MGGICHRLAHFAEQVKEVFLGNMATADAMVSRFVREESGFGSNLRPLKSQLLVAIRGALKL